jgi:hypothetical protein
VPDLSLVADETLVAYAAGGVAVELFHAGEGPAGVFDPCADEDTPLLRFAAQVRDPSTGAWREGCSACTSLTPDDDPVALVAAARTIHAELARALAQGGSTSAACARLEGLSERDAMRRLAPAAA